MSIILASHSSINKSFLLSFASGNTTLGHFALISRLMSQHLKLRLSSYEIHGPTPRATRSRSPASAAEIPGALRQSEGLLLARMSDVIHHPMRYHDNTSAHDILTSNIIIRRKSTIPSDIPIQNPYLLHIGMCSITPVPFHLCQVRYIIIDQ